MGMQATKARMNSMTGYAPTQTEAEIATPSQQQTNPIDDSAFSTSDNPTGLWPTTSSKASIPSRTTYGPHNLPDTGEWQQRLEQAMERLQQTKGIQSLKRTTPSGGVQVVGGRPQRNASLQDIRHEGANLLQTIQGLPLPPAQKKALQQSLTKLTAEGGNPIQGLLQVNQQLHQTLGHLMQTQTPRAGRATAATSPSAAQMQGTSKASNPSVRKSAKQEVNDVDKAEKKEKSIWEKIGDFFKKAFEIFLKVFDFLSPLLNFIPGIGPALFAAYQGVKLIVSIVKGDINGVVSSLASMAGGIGGAVSGVAGTVLKMASKITQAGQAMVQAVESKNPLAALGALGSVAGGVGGLGKSLGKLGGAAAQAGKTIATAMNHTQQGIQLATAGATMIDGAAKGDVDKVMAGLGSAVQGSSSMVGGTTGQIMRHANQGVQSIYHLSQGRMGAALHGFAGAIAPMSQIPEAKEVMKYVQSGLAMAGDLSSGKWNQATQRLLQTVATQAPGNSDVRKAIQHVQPILGFVGSLAQSATTQPYHQMQQNWTRVLQQPDFVRAMQWCVEAGKTMERLATQPPEVAKKQMQTGQLSQQYQQAVDSGQWQQGLNAFLQQMQQFLHSPSLSKVSNHLQQGKTALLSLQQGSWKQSMQSLYNHVPQARNEVQQLQDSMHHAQTFVGGLLSQQFGQAMGSLMQQQPELNNDAVTQDMLAKSATMKTYLEEVASGKTYDNIRETKNQLQTSMQEAQEWV